MAPKCNCYMFSSRGTCYHTGYKPTFRENSPPILIPRAVRRMHKWVKETAGKRWPDEKG